MNKETKELTPEGKMIDVKKLLADPYETLINLLIEQPKNEKLQSAIPNGTKVLGAELKGDVVYLDLSNEFIENNSVEEKTIINAIVNTLTELNEVNGVKILINGQENKEFKGGYDDIINIINNGLNNKKAADVRDGIITELIKRAGQWIFRYPIA